RRLSLSALTHQGTYATPTHGRLDARFCRERHLHASSRPHVREAIGNIGVLYNLKMKHFIVDSGSFVTTTGIYRLMEHPEREITLVYADVVPTFQKRNVKWRLIRAAKHPRRG